MLALLPEHCLHCLHPSPGRIHKTGAQKFGTALLMCMGNETELTVWPELCYFDYTIASVFSTCAVEYITDLFIHEERGGAVVPT